MAALPAPSKRYVIRMLFFALLFAGGIYAAKSLIVGQGVGGTMAYAIALIPGLAAVGMIWSTGQLITETKDEFLRMLVVRQQLIATGFAISIACVWGTLETFGLVPHAEAFYILILWSVGVVIGAVSNLITHGAGGA